MIVEIKQISVVGDDVILYIRCSYTEQHRLEVNEYKNRVQQLHLGAAILTQDGK
jgi:hypothetical protein